MPALNRALQFTNTRNKAMKNILLSTAVATLLAACGGSGASDKITADDANIDLSKEKKGSVVIRTPNGKLHGYNQNASFYGLWVDDFNAKRELRYRGDKTENVPQSGKAVYEGKAVRWDTVTDGVYTKGTSIVNVDFGERTVRGELKFDGARRNITLNEGPLRGAEYRGTASVVGNDKGRYEGALYGENAKETAGQVVFADESSLNTAFGGERQ